MPVDEGRKRAEWSRDKSEGTYRGGEGGEEYPAHRPWTLSLTFREGEREQKVLDQKIILDGWDEIMSKI